MEEHVFWTRSWESFDTDRVAAYMEYLDQTPDPIIDCLAERKVNSVCDAGCGCGAYSLKLARRGFAVAGFDISEDAVLLAKGLLSENGYPAHRFKTASIVSTGFADESFDAVVARDVIDHLSIKQGAIAVKELLRITRQGGCVLFTLDATDEEYEAEPHEINKDGDYLFHSGKWEGMVFHPYSLNEIKKLTAGLDSTRLFSNSDSFIVMIEKR